ncbi:MAG: hypothetical protein QM754_06345 [Tepidisphaeraceae bacterium]
MSQLRYLLEEICAGVEIYFTGRSGGQYLKTAFILCDDYTELTSKLFLLTDNPAWSDQTANGRFKNYHAIQQDVRAVFSAKRAADLPIITKLHAEMASRRSRRNDFFHSTNLLDLNVSQPRCVEALVDLLDYGLLLFPADWQQTVVESRNLETLEVLLRLEKRGFSDPSVLPRVNQLLAAWPRNLKKGERAGVHIAVHPEDLHLRLCVTCGGKGLRDKLAALL